MEVCSSGCLIPQRSFSRTATGLILILGAILASAFRPPQAGEGLVLGRGATTRATCFSGWTHCDGRSGLFRRSLGAGALDAAGTASRAGGMYLRGERVLTYRWPIRPPCRTNVQTSNRRGAAHREIPESGTEDVVPPSRRTRAFDSWRRHPRRSDPGPEGSPSAEKLRRAGAPGIGRQGKRSPVPPDGLAAASELPLFATATCIPRPARTSRRRALNYTLRQPLGRPA